jgi:Protein of unknown function (DUF1552)
MPAKNKPWLCSRRAFLGGLGAVGFNHLLAGPAHAQLSQRKRFIVVYVPEGMWAGADRPAPGADTLGSIFGPLDPFRSKITALDGIDLATAISDRPGVDEHHRLPHLLTCTKMLDGRTGGGPSIDQKIAQVIGGGSTFQSLQFGVQIVYKDGSGRPIWKGRGEQLPAMEDPWMAYERIFGGQVAQPGPAGQPERKFDLRKSALDYSLGEIASMQPRLAASDRVRVDSYQASLRDIERRLQGIQGAEQGAGGACAAPAVGAPTDIKAKANFPKISQLQMDLMVAAMQCGATNVASLQYGNSVDQCTYPWLGVRRTGHDLSHGSSRTEQQKVYHWYSEQFAYLLGKLQAVPEGAGTMLDNTVVVWVSEFGNSSSHSLRNLMWFVMGNVGGFLRQGQVLKLPGRSVSDLHVTLAHAFGIQEPTFGDPAFCTGPIAPLIA